MHPAGIGWLGEVNMPHVPLPVVCVPAPPGVFLPVPVAGCVLWVWMDGCEVRLCDPPCVSRLPRCGPVSFYGKPHERDRF
jgi:hypothetical protein